MAGINTGKVIVGGLVAGLVFNILDFLNNMLILGNDFAANATRLGLDPEAANSPAGIATWVIIDFLIGFVVIWTYASMRPRHGPGPKTAIYAALVPYLATTFIMFGLAQGGIISQALFWKMAGLQLVVSVVGGLAGARFYTEA